VGAYGCQGGRQASDLPAEARFRSALRGTVEAGCGTQCGILDLRHTRLCASSQDAAFEHAAGFVWAHPAKVVLGVNLWGLTNRTARPMDHMQHPTTGVPGCPLPLPSRRPARTSA
jgi:hypothetical protein